MVLFDGDSSGRSAAERSLPILLAEGLFPKSITLPDNLDPDDYLKKYGVSRLESLITNAPDLFLSLFQEMLKAYHGQPTDKVTVVNKLSESLISVSDEALRKLYIEEVAATLQQKPTWVMGILKSKTEKKFIDAKGVGALSSADSFTKRQDIEPNPMTPLTFLSVERVHLEEGALEEPFFNLTKATRAELYLINLMLMKEKFLKQWKAGAETSKMKQYLSQEVSEIINYMLGIYGQNINNFDKLTALLANKVEPVEYLTQHLDISWENMDDQALEKLYRDCLKKIHELGLTTQQNSLKDKLRSSDPEERQKHLEQFMNIQKQRRLLKQNNKSN